MNISYPDPPEGYGAFDNQDEIEPELIFTQAEVYEKFKELFNI